MIERDMNIGKINSLIGRKETIYIIRRIIVDNIRKICLGRKLWSWIK
jgi:hypothetical protein